MIEDRKYKSSAVESRQSNHVGRGCRGGDWFVIVKDEDKYCSGYGNDLY
jgi:hypothetical protein